MKDLKINFEKRLDLMEEEIENKNSIIEKLKRSGINQNETVFNI